MKNLKLCLVLAVGLQAAVSANAVSLVANGSDLDVTTKIGS